MMLWQLKIIFRGESEHSEAVAYKVAREMVHI